MKVIAVVLYYIGILHLLNSVMVGSYYVNFYQL